MTTRPRVVVLASLPAVGLDLLRERFAVDVGGHAGGAAAIVTDPSVPVDADLLDEAGSSLAVVANFGVGYDNVDLDAARARGVQVTNTPGVLTTATAELAVALMLATARRIAEADATVRSGEWARSDADELIGRDVIVVHRLLKNSAEAVLGGKPYALFTDACIAAMGADPAALGLVRHSETIDLIGEMV